MTTTNGTLEGIVGNLREEESRIADHVGKLAAQLDEANHQLKKVKTALRQLTAAPGQSKAGRKPSAKIPEVESVLTSLLRDRPELSREQLCKEAETQLVAAGRSRSGLSTRIDEVLTSGRFEKTSKGHRLKASARQPAAAIKEH